MLICDSKITSNMDKCCIEYYGIPELLLMESAARVAVERIEKINLDNNCGHKKIAIVCGSGNNGGDGFAIARILYNHNFEVDLILVGNQSSMSESAKINFDITQNMGINTMFIDSRFDLEQSCIESMENILKSSDLIIDCIFGAGLNRNVEGIYEKIIKSINNFPDISTVSIDIPSGLNGTTGNVMGVSVIADYTISFEYFKKGFLRYDAELYTGKVFTEKIGVPKDAKYDLGLYAEFIDENYVKNKLMSKKDHCHKGDFGKVCVIAGSKEFSGASYITTRAAVRTGSGLTTLIADEDVKMAVLPKFIEEMFCDIDDIERVRNLLEKADAIAFGPGKGINDKSREQLQNILKNYSVPKVIDADGISLLKDLISVQDIDLSNCIITPHIGEFSKITGESIECILEDRVKAAVSFAKKHNLTVVLKGKNTVISNGEYTMVNTTGNSGMANGGMGDLLTGIIASLCGQGYQPFEAACIGVYIHGLCGDEIYNKYQTVNASDLIKIIPKIMKMLYNGINK